jgi:hypothetical protein
MGQQSRCPSTRPLSYINILPATVMCWWLSGRAGVHVESGDGPQIFRNGPSHNLPPARSWCLYLFLHGLGLDRRSGMPRPCLEWIEVFTRHQNMQLEESPRPVPCMHMCIFNEQRCSCESMPWVGTHWEAVTGSKTLVCCVEHCAWGQLMLYNSQQSGFFPSTEC